MTDKAKFSQAEIRRAIRAAQKEGLPIRAVRPDGTIIIGDPLPVGLDFHNIAASGVTPWWDELE